MTSSPPVTDSDLIYLAIKRLEACAEKMMKHEYDEQLDEMMNVAAEWFQWAAYNMNRRSGVQTVPEGEDDVDPFERAAIIAETLMSGKEHADYATIASGIRAWKRTPVSGNLSKKKKEDAS